MSLATTLNLEIDKKDVKTTFLQGDCYLSSLQSCQNIVKFGWLWLKLAKISKTMES